MDQTERETFKKLQKEFNLSYKDIAEMLGMKYESVKNQLAPSKKLPKWAVSMVFVYSKFKS
tara:strand:- start:15 stop:197 length:183 start_codon:yes stop_codon:yes gene_type:complete